MVTHNITDTYEVAMKAIWKIKDEHSEESDGNTDLQQTVISFVYKGLLYLLFLPSLFLDHC